MLRTCIRNVTLNRNGFIGAANRFNSTGQNRTTAKEIRDVKIIGTIYQNPLAMDSGSKLLTIKTTQSDGHYKVHRALVKNPKILNMIGNNLSFGQRVYITGELRSKSYQNKDNQYNQRITIFVNELYASKSAASETNAHDSDGSGVADATKHTDYNSVFLLSHIVWDIQHLDTFSRFYLSSNVTVRNPDSGEGDSQKREFYNVFIHDPNLINYAKENLKRKDRVFVNGFLNYKSELDQDGKKQVNGYVEATNIFKIDRFSELSSENPVDDRIKSANE